MNERPGNAPVDTFIDDRDTLQDAGDLVSDLAGSPANGDRVPVSSIGVAPGASEEGVGIPDIALEDMLNHSKFDGC